jgi:hypothetical protein
LKVLRRSGPVTGHRVDDDARLRVYELRQEPFTALQARLDQVQASGPVSSARSGNTWRTSAKERLTSDEQWAGLGWHRERCSTR